MFCQFCQEDTSATKRCHYLVIHEGFEVMVSLDLCDTHAEQVIEQMDAWVSKEYDKILL